MNVIWRIRDIYRYHHSELKWYVLGEKDEEMVEIFRQEMGLNVKHQFGGRQVY